MLHNVTAARKVAGDSCVEKAVSLGTLLYTVLSESRCVLCSYEWVALTVIVAATEMRQHDRWYVLGRKTKQQTVIIR